MHLLKSLLVTELAGMLTSNGQAHFSLEEIDNEIARGAIESVL